MPITHLFLKKESKAPMISLHEIILEREKGISGNKYQGNLSPRQILITRLETLGKYNLKPGELRENIVISNFPVDELISGQVIKIGNAEIRITFSCEPCGFVESLQPGLLRKIQNERGILGIVYKSGKIKIGDDVEIVRDIEFPNIPYKILDRFRWLVNQIPEGKVITYKQIIETLGLWSSVYRALPAFIKSMESEIPVHRIVDSEAMILKHLPNQKELLEKESVKVIDGKVDLNVYGWNTEGLYLKQII